MKSCTVLFRWPVWLRGGAFASTLFAASASAVTFHANTTIASGDGAYDGQAVEVDGCTLTIDGPHQFASLALTNNAVVTHSPWSADQPANRLDLTVTTNVTLAAGCSLQGNVRLVVGGDMQVPAGATVSANGRGYPLGSDSGPGTGGINAWAYGGGGGHGGPGGNGNPGGGNAAGGGSYGSITEPTTPGSKGGGSGGAGGGTIRLAIAGTLSLGGTLSADGDKAVVYWSAGGGGAGGGIWITADNLTGSGAVTADGGDGDTFGAVGGGGGGGRIAIESASGQHTGARHAWPGGGASYGGPGTVFVKSSAHPDGELLIDAGGRPGAMLPLPSQATLHVAVANGATACTQGPVSLAAMRVAAGGTVTHRQGSGSVELDITGDLFIEAGGRISADACGYCTAAASGPGAGLAGGSGGGHGGNGGNRFTGIKGGPAYGSISAPVDYGSRGGDGTYGAGGAGGGAIRLEVGGTLTVNGRLSAEGAGVAAESAAGSGAGGSLWVTAHTLTGSGVISVKGGEGDTSYWYGGGGGAGGRAAVCFTVNAFGGAWLAQGGSGKARGGAGTVFTKLASEAFGTVRIDNGVDSGWGAVTPVSSGEPFHLVLANFATVQFARPATLASLGVGSNGWITPPAAGTAIDLVILGGAHVDAGGRLTTDGLGYPFGGQNGPGAGTAIDHGGSGGGHGGAGGLSWTGAEGGAAYGQESAPVECGSAGGPSLEGVGGTGGGIIRLSVGGDLRLDGEITSNGNPGLANNSGGGAGGSIWLSVGSLTGIGLVAANGGSGESVDGGGGGGGRIAVHGEAGEFPAARLQVHGAIGCQTGGNGTVFLGSHLAPRVETHFPVGFTMRPPDHFDIDFDQGIDPATLSAAMVQVTGPGGPIPAAQVGLAALGGRTWRISFPPQAGYGRTSFTLAPGARSVFGDAMTTAAGGSTEYQRRLNLARNGSQLRFSWPSDTASRYQLQSTTTLAPGGWTDEGPEVDGTGGEMTREVSLETVARKLFRLRILDR